MTNIPDELDMGMMGMDRTSLKNEITWKLHNETDHGCLQECVGDCDKVGTENVPKECPDGATNNGTYDAVILERGERSQVVRSYAEVTREYGKTPLGQNRLIISYIISFIKV